MIWEHCGAEQLYVTSRTFMVREIKKMQKLLAAFFLYNV